MLYLNAVVIRGCSFKVKVQCEVLLFRFLLTKITNSLSKFIYLVCLVLNYLYQLYSAVYAQYEEFISPTMDGSVFCARLQGLVTLPCETTRTVTQGEYHDKTPESRATHILRVLLVSYRTDTGSSSHLADLWHHKTFQLDLLVSVPLSLHHSFWASSFLRNRKQFKWVEILMAVPQIMIIKSYMLNLMSYAKPMYVWYCEGAT